MQHIINCRQIDDCSTHVKLTQVAQKFKECELAFLFIVPLSWYNHLRSPQVGTERMYSTWQITDILARVQRVTPTIRRPSRAHFPARPAPAVVEAITVQCIPAHRHEWTRQKIIVQSHRTAQIRTM